MISRRQLLGSLALAAAPLQLASAQGVAHLDKLWDVIIIGSGLAGLSAAVSAKENGAERVLVIEKTPLLGGHSKFSSGSFCACLPTNVDAQGRKDSPELMGEEIFEGGGRIGNIELIRTLAEQSRSAYEWLASMGVRWSGPFIPVGAVYPRGFHAQAPLPGFDYVLKVNRTARELGVTFLFSHRVLDLLTDSKTGRVNGVVIRGEVGQLKYLLGKSVIIATGGYTEDKALRQKYDPRLSPSLTSTANPYGRGLDTATGDGLKMAVAIGADTFDLEHIQTLFYLGGRLLDYVGGDIYLDPNGKRFVNEGETLKEISDTVLTLGLPEIWVLTDSKSHKGPNFENRVKNGIVNKCASLEEVAAVMHCPVSNLGDTVMAYNFDAASGKDSQFHKTTVLQQINLPPYFVGKEKLAVHYCCGGLKCDAKARVLDIYEEPIGGLYVAGEASGGIHGKNRMGGCSLVVCVVFGRIAGKEAAKLSS